MADGPMNTPALDRLLSLCPKCWGSIIAGGLCRHCEIVKERKSRPDVPASKPAVDLIVGETIDVIIDSPTDARPSVVTAIGETSFLAKVPRMGEMQIPFSSGWWRRRDPSAPLPAGGQIGRAP